MTQPYCIGSDCWNGLSKLIEELGELQQVCGKLIGSEGEHNHWSGDLREKFIEEIGDVHAALDFFVQENFDIEEEYLIVVQTERKIELFNEWNKNVQNAAS